MGPCSGEGTPKLRQRAGSCGVPYVGPARCPAPRRMPKPRAPLVVIDRPRPATRGTRPTLRIAPRLRPSPLQGHRERGAPVMTYAIVSTTTEGGGDGSLHRQTP